jgi:hypothetical protein
VRLSKEQIQRPEVFDRPLSADARKYLLSACNDLGLSDGVFERLEFTARLLRDFEAHQKGSLKSERQKNKDLEAVTIAAEALAAAISELDNHQCLELSYELPPEGLSIWQNVSVDSYENVTATYSIERVDCRVAYPLQGFRVAHIGAEARRLAKAANNHVQENVDKQAARGGRVKTSVHYAWHIGRILENISWDEGKPTPIKLGRGGAFERLCEAVFAAAGVGTSPEGPLRQFIADRKAAENNPDDLPF